MIALAVAVALGQAPAPTRTSVQVSPFTATASVPQEEAALLTNALESELAQYQGLRVFGAGDLRQMLAEARNRQQLGCDLAAESCLIEVAGALGASWLATGSVGKLEGALVLTLRLRDLKKHSLLADLTATSPAESSAVLETLHRTVLQLVDRADPELARTRLAGNAIAAAHPTPSGVWWLGGVGLGVALVGAGVLGGGANLGSNAVTLVGGTRYVSYQHQITANTLGYVGQAAIGVGLTAVAAAAIWYLVNR